MLKKIVLAAMLLLLGTRVYGQGSVIGATLATDTFLSGPGPLSSNWTVQQRYVDIVEGPFVETTSPAILRPNASFTGIAWPSNQWSKVELVVNGPDNVIGPAVLMSPKNNYYAGYIGVDNRFRIIQSVNGFTTGLATSAPKVTHVAVTGDIEELDVQGTLLSLYLNGALVLQASSTTFTAGAPGISGNIGTLNNAPSSSQLVSAWSGGTFSTTPVLDQYGGRTDIHCATALPYFHLEKIGVRWYFCTPSGHAFISMSIGAMAGNTGLDCNKQPTQPHVIAKYGDINYNWGWQSLKRMTTWGFNTVGQDSVSHVSPYDTCSNCSWPGHTQPIKVPFIVEMKPAEYAMVNQFGYLASPLKDVIQGTNTHYNSWRGGALPDVFDPGLSVWMQKTLAVNDVDHPVQGLLRNNYPYLLGIFTDDSDFFSGSAGAGPDFPTGPPGHSGANSGLVTLMTSPVQTYIQSTSFENLKFLYSVPQNFSKTLATNPTVECSIQNPCSLRDYLWQKYGGNIATLNTAWGSNYTSFDSTGTQVTGEVIDLADGTKTVFTHTLAHSPISPFSMTILMDGVARIGDCPFFHAGCLGSKPTSGSLGSPTNLTVQPTSLVNYANGLLTVTFLNPPNAGAAITVNYIYGGWMAGGTGLMDEDGSHAWLGTNLFCLEGPDPNYPSYFICNGVVGPGNRPVPNANPALAVDLDNWVSQLAAKYFKTMRDDIRATGSKIPYLGLDIMGSWGAPAYSKFLMGAAPYIDAGFVGEHPWAPAPSPAAFESGYQYTTQYLGDIPLLNFASGGTAEADSSMSCFPASPTDPNNSPTQATRGQRYFDMVHYLLTTPGSNGTYPFVGFGWWAWIDSQALNMGLISVHDNAYDGIEAVQATVSCDSYYSVLPGATCGGEAANYGDVITPVKAANQLWLK